MDRGDVKKCTVEISNLVDGLEKSDLLEIFDSVKDKVKKATVNSDGTAKLVFSTLSLAVDATKEYDRAKVDGRPMFLRLLGEDATAAHVNKFVVEKSDGPSRPARRDELPEMSGVDVSEVIPVSELEFAQLEADSLRAQLADTQASVCKSNLALHLALEEAEEVRRRERYLVLRDEQLRGEVAALKSYLGKGNNEALALSLQRAHELATANCKVEIERSESVTGLAKVSHELEAAAKAAKMYLGLLQQTRAQLTEALRTRQEAITHANHRAEAEMAARDIQSEQNRVLEEACWTTLKFAPIFVTQLILFFFSN
jgi:hypothetical protein